jgi:ribose 5-phosphate isomerase A
VNLKQEAARHALSHVRSGMNLGLGTGSTTAQFIHLLAERLGSGALRDIRAVPTSDWTAARARELGIPLTTLAETPRLDLAVDGADEVDPDLNLIKGLGRALLREKVVEIHADCFLVLVDESKLVRRLGSKGPLPVEILPFQAPAHVRWLNTLGCRAELWLEEDGSPAVTDNGNYLARCWFPDGIADCQALARLLADRPGILEHGLFLDMASAVIVAGRDGIRTRERKWSK